jgi:ferredoxin-NADP reductase
VVGDRFEVRGPIGGYFVWESSDGGPLLLVAGGSGIVPLMAMVRHRAATRAQVPTRLLYSSRSIDDIIYRAELDGLARRDGLEVFHTLTRAQPDGWQGFSRRIDDRMVAEVNRPFGARAQVFICGPTALVETAADAAEAASIPAERIKTERFGPTGT